MTKSNNVLEAKHANKDLEHLQRSNTKKQRRSSSSASQASHQTSKSSNSSKAKTPQLTAPAQAPNVEVRRRAPPGQLSPYPTPTEHHTGFPIKFPTTSYNTPYSTGNQPSHSQLISGPPTQFIGPQSAFRTPLQQVRPSTKHTHAHTLPPSFQPTQAPQPQSQPQSQPVPAPDMTLQQPIALQQTSPAQPSPLFRHQLQHHKLQQHLHHKHSHHGHHLQPRHRQADFYPSQSSPPLPDKMAGRMAPGRWGDAQQIVENLVQSTEQVAKQTEQIIQQQESKQTSTGSIQEATNIADTATQSPQAALDILKPQLLKDKTKTTSTTQPAAPSTVPPAILTPAPPQDKQAAPQHIRQPICQCTFNQDKTTYQSTWYRIQQRSRHNHHSQNTQTLEQIYQHTQYHQRPQHSHCQQTHNQLQLQLRFSIHYKQKPRNIHSNQITSLHIQ